MSKWEMYLKPVLVEKIDEAFESTDDDIIYPFLTNDLIEMMADAALLILKSREDMEKALVKEKYVTNWVLPT